MKFLNSKVRVKGGRSVIGIENSKQGSLHQFTARDFHAFQNSSRMSSVGMMQSCLEKPFGIPLVVVIF
jgi:hypothetical protein